MSGPLRTKQDRQGKKWNFSYWSMGIFTPIRAQRLFFWDNDYIETGVIILIGPSTCPARQIEKIADELVREPEFRRLHGRDLRFPLDRYYAEFGSFPEELQVTKPSPDASKKIESV